MSMDSGSFSLGGDRKRVGLGFETLSKHSSTIKINPLSMTTVSTQLVLPVGSVSLIKPVEDWQGVMSDLMMRIR